MRVSISKNILWTGVAIGSLALVLGLRSDLLADDSAHPLYAPANSAALPPPSEPPAGQSPAAQPPTTQPPALLPPPPAPSPASPPPALSEPYTETPNAYHPPSPPPDEEPYYYPRRHRRYGGGSSSWETTTTLLNFRFAGLGAFQSGASVYSLMLSWNPQVTMKNGSYLGFNLGGTELTNSLAQNTFVLEYQGVLGGQFAGPVGLELGIGAQTWFNQGETDPLLSVSLFCRIQRSVLDRVFLGYSAYLMSYFYTSEVKLGIGLSF